MVSTPDGVDSTSGRAVTLGRVSGDDAILEVETVGVDTSAIGSAIPARIVITNDLVSVDRGMVERESSPNREASAAGESVGLRGRPSDGFCLRVSASDIHVLQGEIAADREHAGRVQISAGPLDGDAIRKRGSVEHHVLLQIDRRFAVIAIGVSLKRHAAVGFTREGGVILAYEVEFDGGTVEAGIEGNRIGGRDLTENAAERVGAGRRLGDIVGGVHDVGGKDGWVGEELPHPAATNRRRKTAQRAAVSGPRKTRSLLRLIREPRILDWEEALVTMASGGYSMQ